MLDTHKDKTQHRLCSSRGMAKQASHGELHELAVSCPSMIPPALTAALGRAFLSHYISGELKGSMGTVLYLGPSTWANTPSRGVIISPSLCA